MITQNRSLTLRQSMHALTIQFIVTLINDGSLLVRTPD